jgi:hypothetical protein
LSGRLASPVKRAAAHSAIIARIALSRSVCEHRQELGAEAA